MRVFQHKITIDGEEYDSKDEYEYHRMLLEDESVSNIHRQVRLNLIPPAFMIVPKQLKTKVRYDKRQLYRGHYYTADFVYRWKDRIVICDVKSKYTSKLREFQITLKCCISKIIRHNIARHKGEPYIIFRKAIKVKKGVWDMVDYPPQGCSIV